MKKINLDTKLELFRNILVLDPDLLAITAAEYN